MKDLTWTVLAAEDGGGGGGTYPAEVEAPEVVPDPVPEDPEVAATGPFSFSSFSTRCSSAKICSFWMICSWRVAPALSCFFNTATKMVNNKTIKRKKVSLFHTSIHDETNRIGCRPWCQVQVWTRRKRNLSCQRSRIRDRLAGLRQQMNRVAPGCWGADFLHPDIGPTLMTWRP